MCWCQEYPPIRKYPPSQKMHYPNHPIHSQEEGLMPYPGAIIPNKRNLDPRNEQPSSVDAYRVKGTVNTE